MSLLQSYKDKAEKLQKCLFAELPNGERGLVRKILALRDMIRDWKNNPDLSATVVILEDNLGETERDLFGHLYQSQIRKLNELVHVRHLISMFSEVEEEEKKNKKNKNEKDDKKVVKKVCENDSGKISRKRRWSQCD